MVFGKKNKLIDFDVLLANKHKGYSFIGIDEVGRGSLAGPVIACAFMWKENINSFKKTADNYILKKLNDSKQLTREERERLYSPLVKAGNFALGYASVIEIEKLNILNASLLAMKRAYDLLLKKLNSANLKTFVLIDGNKFNPYIDSMQLPIVKGDATSSIIAGASVIAKVYRDHLMNKISSIKEFKHFAWQKNSGYGTAFHLSAIKKNGISLLHRKLFVRKVMSGSQNYKISTAMLKD